MLTFHLEHAHYPKRVCGVDEAGRGPWAGPVVAAAVSFFNSPPEGESKRPCVSVGGSLSGALTHLNDSKKLSAAKREALFETIYAQAAVGVGIASVEEIDALNIWGATMLAMRRAFIQLAEQCGAPPELALIDGKARPNDFPCATEMVIGGDGISPSIAAASIVAKVTRDRMMRDYAHTYPHYGFERHAGYGTKQHQDALATHGPCPIHRRSFAPIRAMLEAV